MAISIEWDTYIINVPQSFLTAVGGTSYNLDTNAFRLALRDIEDNEEGVVHPPTHNHNTKVLLGGIEYARILEILSPYTITFEDTGSPYKVFLQGSNNNILDVTNLNNVSVAPNNSAGLVQMQEIEFSEYANGIFIDTGPKGAAGLSHPHGTQRLPSNNITDAVTIANTRGVKVLRLESNLNITESVTLSGYLIKGNNHVNTELQIGSSAIIDNLKLLDVTVKNTTLDGDVDIRDCVVQDIQYLNGHIHGCGLAGTITLGGNRESVIESCYTVDQDDPPVINMGGSGNDLAMANYSGLVTITNLNSATEEIGIGLNAGMVTLDATIVDAADIIVAGNGLCVNNSLVDEAKVNTQALMNLDAITEHIMTYAGP